MDDDKFWGVFGIIGAAVLVSVFSGYVLDTTWGWFVVPIFPVPELGIVRSMGLALVINYLVDSGPSNEAQPSLQEKVLYSFSRSLSVLVIGFVYSQFIRPGKGA